MWRGKDELASISGERSLPIHVRHQIIAHGDDIRRIRRIETQEGKPVNRTFPAREIEARNLFRRILLGVESVDSIVRLIAPELEEQCHGLIPRTTVPQNTPRLLLLASRCPDLRNFLTVLGQI